MTWYSPEELKAEALAGQRQPEFAPEAEEAVAADDTEAMDALDAKLDEIAATVAGFTQAYPTVSSDAPLPS
jgi:hypothetical protein